MNKTFGRYEVVDSLGRGGMAEVYRARDPMLDRNVAIKVILPHLAADEMFEERFLREAKLVASLSHPNIIRLFDFGLENGLPFMVMEYLGYGTLKDRIKEYSPQNRTMPLEDIARIISPVTNALDYAHENDAIHRDIKPANILFTSNRDPVITDFGIAKILVDTGHLTLTGGIVGSPQYMSPEQAASEPVHKYSDIYSLGVMVYEMSTGQPPFQGDTVTGILMQHLNEPPPQPRDLNPNIPQSVQEVIIQSLAKKPLERYASAGEFANAFNSSLRGDPAIEVSPTDETVLDQPHKIITPSLIKDEKTGSIQEVVPSVDSLPPTLSEAVPPILTPSRQKTPWFLIAAALLILITILSLGTYIILGGDLFSRSQQVQITNVVTEPTDISEIIPSPATPTIVSEAIAISTPPPTEEITADVQWTSWTAGNNLSEVAIWDSEVVAGGWGGVVFRNLESDDYWRLTTGDGLADPWVRSLLVDKDDSLWIGTAEGLHHLIGDIQIYYDIEDGLDSAFVTAIVPYDDNLVVGTMHSSIGGGGLNIFDGISWKQFEGFPSDLDNPGKLSADVMSIVQDQEGHLWVGTTNGIGFFNGESWLEYNATSDGLPDNYVNVLYVDDNGDLWAGTDNGVAKYGDGSFQSIDTLHGFITYGIVQDLDGGYWFSGDGGIVHNNTAHGDWEHFEQENSNLTSSIYYRAIRSEDGTLYFGSEASGVVRYDGGEFSEFPIPNLPTIASFGKIVPYPQRGLIFVEEWGSYADLFETEIGTWKPLYDLPCCIIPYLFEDDGNIWGNGDQGLWLMEPDRTVTNWTTKDGLPSDEVTTIAVGPDNQLWIGTSEGVALVDLTTMTVTDVYDTSNTDFEDDYINALLHSADGSMWVGTDYSLNHLLSDGRWEQFTYRSPFNDDMWKITDLDEDTEGGIWVTTLGDGVYYYLHGEWTRFSLDSPGISLPSNDVQTVAVAPDGSVWFGTDYSGAAVYRDGEWQTFGIDDGLMHSNVTDIYIDEDDAVWFATSGGISRYLPSAIPSE